MKRRWRSSWVSDIFGWERKLMDIHHKSSIDLKTSFFVPMCFSDHNGSFVFIWVWVSHPGHVTSVSVEVFVFRELEGDLIIKLEGFRPLKPSWGTMPYPTWRGKSTAPPSYLWRGYYVSSLQGRYLVVFPGWNKQFGTIWFAPHRWFAPFFDTSKNSVLQY